MRAGILSLALVGLLVAPAAGAVDDVSVTLTPGAGLLLSGEPSLHLGPAGLSSLSFEAVAVLDATGSSAGWSLSAQVTSDDGVSHLGEIVPSMDHVALPPEPSLVTLTASSSL